MKYLLRLVKYFVLLCVLYVVLVWLMNYVEPSGLGLWELVMQNVNCQKGYLMIGGFVVLAAFYPLFGFMRSRVDDCDIVEDRVRIDNAMRLFGFRFVEEREGKLIYRAEGLLHRLWLVLEDRIEVRKVDGGVELYGIRKAVARVMLQLKAYIANRRFEQNDNE